MFYTRLQFYRMQNPEATGMRISGFSSVRNVNSSKIVAPWVTTNGVTLMHM
jgi:hypothetical protein